jgi:hypothetical protein
MDVDLMLHHDNLPATGYNFNNVDITERVRRATKALQDAIAEEMQVLTTGGGQGEDPSLPKLTLDADAFRTIDDGQAPQPILLFNSLAWERHEVVELRVSRSDLLVTTSTGELVPSQVAQDVGEDGAWRLFFPARVAPLGFATYFLSVCTLTHWTMDTPRPANCSALSVALTGDQLLAQGLQTRQYALTFSNETCGADTVVVKPSSQRLRLGQTFQSYMAPADSVYMFNPTSPPRPKVHGRCGFTAFTGPLVQEARMASAEGVTYSLRLIDSDLPGLAAPIGLAMTVGGLQPFEDVVVSFETDVVDSPTTAAATFDLHENGYERAQIVFNASDLLGANFKPFVSRAALRSHSPQGLDLHVCGHSPHAIASRSPGQLELMIHRRAAYQPLRGNDVSTVALSPIWLLPGPAEEAEAWATALAARLQAPLLPMTADRAVPGWAAGRKLEYTAVEQPLPEDVHLLAVSTPAFGAEGTAAVVLQFENLSEGGGSLAPRTVEFDLRGVLGREVRDVRERTITTAFPLSRMGQRMMWRPEGAEGPDKPDGSGCLRQVVNGRLLFEIEPKNICTFEVR